MTRITRITRRTPLEAWSEVQGRNARNVNGDKRRTHTYILHNILVGGFPLVSSTFTLIGDLLCSTGVMLRSLSARGPVQGTPKACRTVQLRP